MRVLLTGATGLIGRELGKRLAARGDACRSGGRCGTMVMTLVRRNGGSADGQDEAGGGKCRQNVAEHGGQSFA